MTAVSTAPGITDPGVYLDIPNPAYHAETAWLSASQLKAYLPEYYKPVGSRDALDVGTVFHTRTFGTAEEIHIHDFASWRSNAAGEARIESDGAGAVPILTGDSTMVDAMVQAVHDHPDAARLLFELPGQNEVSVFAEDPETGLRFKCRPDRLLDGLCVDLKSTSAKPGRESLRRAVLDYGYDLAAAHYLEVLRLAGLDVPGFAFVFAGKQPIATPDGDTSHPVTVVELDDTFLERGRALRQLALDRHTDPVAGPHYEGESGYLTLTCPPWAQITEYVS